MIPMFDYRRDLEVRREEIFAAIGRVLDSGTLILGKEGAAFEQELAQYLGMPHTVGLNSGTDAVRFALECHGVGPGDEVITVPNTAVPTVSAIRELGATVRFADVNEEYLCLDADHLAKVMSKKTKAVVAVHLFGFPMDLDPMCSLAKQNNTHLIEDCAQSLGSTYKGQHTGSIGDVGAFSFYPTKNLGAYGDAGLCAVKSAELSNRLKQMRMYGFTKGDGHAHMEGHNSRLDEIQAAILRVKLTRLGEQVNRRRQLAQLYRELLADCADVRLPAQPTWGEHSYHLFAIRTARRDELMAAFQKNEIGFGIHYKLPIPFMDAYKNLGYRESDIPNATSAAKQLLSLPLFPELTEGEVEQVCRVIRQTLK